MPKPKSATSRMDRCFFVAIAFMLIVGISIVMIASITVFNGMTDMFR